MTVIGQQLISSVRAHAAQNPDFVYHSPWADRGSSSCVYVHNSLPSCIIGHALWDAGLIDASTENSVFNSFPFLHIVAALNLTLDCEEQLWLRDVQGCQDLQEPWGESVNKADMDALARAVA